MFKTLFVLSAFIAFYVGIAYVISIGGPPTIEKGSPEWRDYINAQIKNCMADSLRADLQKSKKELPTMMTREERQASCRAAVLEVDDIFPRPRAQRDD